ncbi:hypothetical protein C8F04DRAFT_1186930 [Mycena alexandri]|uniref:Uncharacterized protein n=1 Tax=Mycena alexandri TaxID=1745969 RepID=A0AAD6SN76_9AGAR|nr:hypothetical protein C8F04DRAFT_1186930 [Mycena alexandri]
MPKASSRKKWSPAPLLVPYRGRRERYLTILAAMGLTPAALQLPQSKVFGTWDSSGWGPPTQYTQPWGTGDGTSPVVDVPLSALAVLLAGSSCGMNALSALTLFALGETGKQNCVLVNSGGGAQGGWAGENCGPADIGWGAAGLAGALLAHGTDGGGGGGVR